MPNDSLKASLKQQKDVLFGFSRNLPKIIEVKLSQLRPNPDQPRKEFDPVSLRELASSIEKHGLLQPIVVKVDVEIQGGFIVVAGGRRFEAHQQLGRESIPAIITDGNADELALIENLQRENLNSVDEAEALSKIQKRYSYTQDDLAMVVGRSRSTIAELLSLNELPDDIRKEARSLKNVNKSQLIELNRIKSPKQQKEVWEKIKRGEATVKTLRSHEGGQGAKSRPLAERLVSEGQSLARHLTQAERKGIALSPEERERFRELYARLKQWFD